MIVHAWCRLLAGLTVLWTQLPPAYGTKSQTADLCSRDCNLDASSVVEVLMNSSISLRFAVNNFNKAQITPAIQDLNSRIRTLNLEAVGIPSEKVPEYTDLLIEFTQIKKELLLIRIILKSLARETIRRADILLSIFNHIEDPQKAQKGLDHAAKMMVKLIKKTERKLNEAEEYIKSVDKRLSTINHDLKGLKDKLISIYKNLEIGQQTSTEISGRKRVKRFIILGLTITGALVAKTVLGAAGIASLGVGIAGIVKSSQSTHALNKIYEEIEEQKKEHERMVEEMKEMHDRYIKESQIKSEKLEEQFKLHEERNREMKRIYDEMQAKYKVNQERILRARRNAEKKALGYQKVLVISASNTVEYFLTKISESKETVKGEILHIKHWKAQLQDLIVFMADRELSGLEKIDKDTFEEMMTNLKEACQNYIDFRLPNVH